MTTSNNTVDNNLKSDAIVTPKTTDIKDVFIDIKRVRPLSEVHNVFKKYLHITDIKRIDTLLAVALSNGLKGTPIWVIFVGNSGDAKTAMAITLDGMDNVKKVDQLTVNTLASGKEGATDLGSEVDGKDIILLIPDLASLISKRSDDKNEIWGQFRNLFDGFINKRTGSGINKKYDNCHITLIAGATPIIRSETLIHAQLGTRELMYDTEAILSDNKDKLNKAWDNEQCEDEMLREMKYTVRLFLDSCVIKDIKIPKDIKEFLIDESTRLSILRATTDIDRSGEVKNPVCPEVPTRVLKQFKRLYICLKSLSDNYTDKDAKEVITHIVNSSGDKIRWSILKFLMGEPDKYFTIPDIQEHLKIGRKAIKIRLEILWNMEQVRKYTEIENVGGILAFNNDGEEYYRGGRNEEVSHYAYKE